MKNFLARTYTGTESGDFKGREHSPIGHQSTEASFQPGHRRAIRHHELILTLPFLHNRKRVLEVGAGAGWQAKTLANLGHEVTAIDIPSSNYIALREWEVLDYDGRNIPASDRSFDAIFSSNVLEHVPNLTGLLGDMSRVLKSDGVAIHIMPSSTWRLWTSIGFYIRRLLQICGRVSDASQESRNNPAKFLGQSRRSLRRMLLPSTHGTCGNWLSELYLFSEHSWRRRLKATEWEISEVMPNRLFYSGAKIFGDKLPLQLRSTLSRFLGSSCKIYILRKKPPFLRAE